MYFASAQGARMQKTKAIPLPEKPNFSFPVKITQPMRSFACCRLTAGSLDIQKNHWLILPSSSQLVPVPFPEK